MNIYKSPNEKNSISISKLSLEEALIEGMTELGEANMDGTGTKWTLGI